jgi:hypothetical protein
LPRAKRKPLPPGQARELEVLELLRGAGFRADPNSKAARPRQTDILAEGHDLTLLVEVKDRKRAVDVNDIDGVRARLIRTTPDVIGIIFATSTITRNAVKEIETDRTREVLVFVRYEIELIRAGKARLLNLISKKRSELRNNGRAWFRTGEGGEYLGVALPRSTMTFAGGRGSASYISSRTGFAHSAFSMEIPDTSRGYGEGVRLTLSLDLGTLSELRDLVGYLHDKFGLSSNGAFTIHQDGASWHGIGVQNLLSTLPDPWARYRAAGMQRAHHSEVISYFDQFRSGWLALTTQQRIPEGSRPGHFHMTDVCIQLPGMPVDLSPYLELCRYTGNEWADFRIVQDRHIQTRRLKKPLRLEAVDTLVRSDEDREKDRWIVGLVARNPFFRKKKLPRELEFKGLSLHDLLQTELILLDVRDHLEEGDEVDYFMLKGIECTDAQFVQVIRPFGTWNKITKRQDGQPILPEAELDDFLPRAKPARRQNPKSRRRRRSH